MPLRWTLALAVLMTGSIACGPRYARVSVLDRGGLTITLRAQKISGGLLDRGFSHPVTISSVRIASILSRIDVRRLGKDADGEREPAVPTAPIFGIAGGVSEALAKATPSQEVVVQSIQMTRRLGIFSRKKLTGLVLWVEGDQLVVSVTHVGYEVEKGPKDKVPEPSAQKPSSQFKVVPGQAMVAVGTNAVAVDWRSPIFRRASNLILGADGRVQRRTILLEEPPEEAPDFDPVASMPTNLSPETLRALADLEDERQDGGISEAEYHRRRRELLGGVSAPKE